MGIEAEDDEISDRDEEGGDDADESEGNEDNSASQASDSIIKWLEAVNAVAEIRKCSWDVVFKLSVGEFFITRSFIQYYNKKQEEEMKKWRKKH